VAVGRVAATSASRADPQPATAGAPKEKALKSTRPAEPSRDTLPARGAGAISLRGAWRLAALLFIVGSLTTIPAMLLLDEAPEPWAYGLAAFGVLSGIVCLTAAWWPVPERWLVLVPVFATVEIAIAVSGHEVFTYLYFFVALFVALVFPRPQQMAPFLGLLAAALLLPLAISDDPARETLLWAIVAAPGVLLTAIVVGRLTAGLEESREAYRQLSTEDGLTGVGNYRSMMDRLRHETARHHRRGREFAVLVLDMDNFKAVNETQGHLVGDMLLTIVGSTIDLKVRTEDAVFRQGGDEFAVIAPETGRLQAERLARRIEHALSRISFGDVQLSATVGVAVFPHDGYEPGELLDAADHALLTSKRRAAPAWS
jgi:diguanylate cyclase (GGDEF)-like protein